MDNSSDNTGIGKSNPGSRGNSSSTKRKSTNKKLISNTGTSSGHSTRQRARTDQPAQGNPNPEKPENIVTENDTEPTDTDLEKEGNDTMEALIVTPRPPVQAMLARNQFHREELRLKKARDRLQQDSRRRETVNLILGTEDEGRLPPGERIKLRRMAYKLTQNALAAAADIEQPSLSLIEKGDRDSSPLVLLKLAALLGINPPTDIYKYYEYQLQAQQQQAGDGDGAGSSNNLPELEAVGAEAGGADNPPQFLFLPSLLNAEDRKLLNNMAVSLLRVRMAERGVLPSQTDEEIKETYRSTQFKQKQRNQGRSRSQDQNQAKRSRSDVQNMRCND